MFLFLSSRCCISLVERPNPIHSYIVVEGNVDTVEEAALSTQFVGALCAHVETSDSTAYPSINLTLAANPPPPVTDLLS